MIPFEFVVAVPLASRGRKPALPVRSQTPSAVFGPEARYWTNEAIPLVALGADAHAFGWVFLRGDHKRVRSCDDDSLRSQPVDFNKLLAEFWGAFLVVCIDDAGTRLLVDPSGMMPVFARVTATHFVAASRARLLFDASAASPSVDFAALGAFLARPELRSRATCLADIREIAPGSLTTIRDCRVSSRQLWQVEDHLPGTSSPSFEQARFLLRSAATDVVAAWRDALGPVAVAVSGGVDSSLICGALAASGSAFSCVTLATSDPGGDERGAARQLAHHLGVRLEEEIYRPESFQAYRSASAELPRPSRKSFLTAVDRMLADARRRLGAETIWDGNGGDNLFCYLHSSAPVADRMRADGLLSRWPETLLDMCKVTGADLGTMIGATLRRLQRGAAFPEWAADRRLLAREPIALESCEPVSRWASAETGRHKGKLDHLALIMRAQLHGHGPTNDAGRFSPLMSQPLLELCLSLPTWLWCHGGMNRALAREAFAAELPPAIRGRMSKAGPDSYLREVFDRNRGVFRELLLGGNLARQGMLDRRAIEQALATDRDTTDSVIYRVLDIVEAENWTHTWQA